MRYSDRHLYKNAYYREQNPATANITQISTDDPDIQAFLKCLARTKAGSQTGISARASRTASEEEGEPVRRAPEQRSPVEKSDDTLAHLGSSLPAALKSAGLELDPSSRMPTLTLKNGFIKLEIGKKNQEVTISIRHGHSFKVPADTELVVDAVLAEIARCFPEKFDLPAFVNRLKAAYSALPGSERGSLSLDEVRRKLRNPAMPGDEFAAALAAVIDERPPEAAGMKLDHTRDIETGFLLPGFEDRGYFGGITFESASQVAPVPVEKSVSDAVARVVSAGGSKEKTPAPASNTREANYRRLMEELEKQTYQDGVSIAAAYLRGMNRSPLPPDPEDLEPILANRAELASLARSVDTRILSGGVSGGKLLDKISILLENMLEELLIPNVNPFDARDGGLAMRKQVVQGTKAALGSGAKQAPLFDLANIFFEIPVEGDTYLDRARLAAKDLNTLLEGQGKTYAGQKLANFDPGNSDLRGLPAVLTDVAYNLGFASIKLFGEQRDDGAHHVERVSKVLNALV